jgi:hypothetical protein
MAHSQVRGVPRPVVPSPVPARSRARAVSPDLAGQHLVARVPAGRHPADSDQEDLRGRAEPPGPCQETALFPDTRRHRGTPPPAVSPGQLVTIGQGSRARMERKASQVRTACTGRQVRTTRKASPVTSARRDSRASRASSARRDSRARMERKASQVRTACTGRQVRTARKVSLVTSARRASLALTACNGRQVHMVRKASLVSSAGQDRRPPMTRSSRDRTEATASLARPAPAKVRRHPPATHHRTGSSAARLAMPPRAALPAQPALGGRPVRTAPEAGAATRGAARRAGSPPPDRARAGTPTTGTRPQTGTARPSTAASMRT